MRRELRLVALGCAAILKAPNASNPVLPVRACGTEKLSAGPCLRRDVFRSRRPASSLRAAAGALHFPPRGGVATAEAGSRSQLPESGHHLHRLWTRRGYGEDFSV